MFNFPSREPDLQRSWFKGRIGNVALKLPVMGAREALKEFGLDLDSDEDVVREVRGMLEDIFDAWKLKYGALPDDTHGGMLSGNPYTNKTIAECPPYVCAGHVVRDYAHLLTHLGAKEHKPLAELENKFGSVFVWATLVLSEAAADRVESATLAYRVVLLESKKISMRQKKATYDLIKNMLPHVERAQIFPTGGSSKKGKEYEPKASIRKVAEQIGSRGRDAVLAYLDNEKNCENIYQAGAVMFDGMDKEKRLLFYFDSERDPDVRQELKFKRLSTILSEIK